MLGLSSTEVVFFFSCWFILCCHGSIGHEIGGRSFSGMSKRDLRLFVYCLRALTHPARYLMLVQIARLSFSDKCVKRTADSRGKTYS